MALCPPTKWPPARLRQRRFCKALSHEGRLIILCHLSEGEKSVTELEERYSAPVRPPSASNSPVCAPRVW